jgi:hypothetical protein
MPASLNAIVQAYLNDAEFLEEGRDIAKNREASLPNLRRTIISFIDGTSSLSIFREQMGKALPTKDTWGARGTAFLMELNKSAKNHTVNIDGSKNTEVENTLRRILTGLNAENLGQRIEQFYTFLQQERTRFSKEKRTRSTNASPGNSALFISLFAHWLDWSGVTFIYYPSLLNGLKMLIEECEPSSIE